MEEHIHMEYETNLSQAFFRVTVAEPYTEDYQMPYAAKESNRWDFTHRGVRSERCKLLYIWCRRMRFYE